MKFKCLKSFENLFNYFENFNDIFQKLIIIVNSYLIK